MSTLNASSRRIAQLIIVSGALMLPAVAATPSADGPGVPRRELQRLASEARTADLRGNWDGLVRAHEAIAALPAPATGRAWIDYYLGYVDWRQSSLAFMGQGMTGTAALLRHAADHLLRALEAVPGFTEARLLLVIVDGGTMNADPQRVAELAPRLRANVRPPRRFPESRPRTSPNGAGPKPGPGWAARCWPTGNPPRRKKRWSTPSPIARTSGGHAISPCRRPRGAERRTTASGSGNISVLPMPTVTVKLDRKRAARLTRWARRRRVSKSDVIRTLIDRGGPIETADDLIEWANASEGKGLGLAQRRK